MPDDGQFERIKGLFQSWDKVLNTEALRAEMDDALAVWVGGQRECALRCDWGNLDDPAFAVLDAEDRREREALEQAERERRKRAQREHLWGIHSPTWRPG